MSAIGSPSTHPTDWPSAPPSISSSPSTSSLPTSMDYATEREILMKLYDATNGDEWHNNDNWNTRTPLCNWFGVSCDENTTVLHSLMLQNNNLNGKMITICVSASKQSHVF